MDEEELHFFLHLELLGETELELLFDVLDFLELVLDLQLHELDGVFGIISLLKVRRVHGKDSGGGSENAGEILAEVIKVELEEDFWEDGMRSLIFIMNEGVLLFRVSYFEPVLVVHSPEIESLFVKEDEFVAGKVEEGHCDDFVVDG